MCALTADLSGVKGDFSLLKNLYRGVRAEKLKAYTKKVSKDASLTCHIAQAFFEYGLCQVQSYQLALVIVSVFSSLIFLSQVVLTSMELLKTMAVEGGASSLQSVELQMSLEEMMEMC